MSENLGASMIKFISINTTNRYNNRHVSEFEDSEHCRFAFELEKALGHRI